MLPSRTELTRVGSRPRRCAFTLLELVISILVVAILILLFFPVLTQVQRRAEKAKCMANLRSLHVATNSYIQDHHMWPQIAVTQGDDSLLATAWIEALKPYGLAQINWVCPTIQKSLQNPDLNDPRNVRVDYTAFPYGRNQQDPFRYSTQPWFIERADVHGNGNLLVFPDGHVEELVDFLRRMKAH